jgi:RNA polymerase sigma-70 factor (ECF subfamily)
LDQPFNAEYVERLIEGHEDVERHFFGYFGPLLAAKSRRDPRTRELADDAAQETFFRVLRNLRRNPNLLEQPAKLGGYVLGVCNLVLMELSRSEYRYQSMEGAEDHRPDPRRSVADELIQAQRRRAVRAVLGELSDKDRLLLERIYLQEQDKDEICREFGIDRAYLRVLVHRAIQRCKGALADEPDGPRGTVQKNRSGQ